jgi:hypothetical protein
METNTLSQNGVGNNSTRAAGLSAFWQSRVCRLGGPDYRMLTPKEHGQLKRLKESLGLEKATQLVEYAIQNWDTFGRRVLQNAAAAAFAAKPHIGFLLKYHAIALTMMQDELQSIAKKQAAEEQAKQQAQAKDSAKAMQELKSKQPSVTLIRLTQEQLHAFLCWHEDSANEAWVDKVSEKYGEWRPDEKGIPCDVELKKAG